MDDIRLDGRAYDPADVNAVLREARRLRNAAVLDMLRWLFGRKPAAAVPARAAAPAGGAMAATG